MITRENFDDDICLENLKKNPDFTKQFLTTLNQVDGLSTRRLRFWSGDDYFKFKNNEIGIGSSNPNNLLKLEYYRILMEISKRNKLDEDVDLQWIYYPDDLIVRKVYEAINDGINEEYDWYYPMQFSIKLDQAIDKYDNQQIASICDFVYDISQLFYKHKKLILSQFKDSYKNIIDHSFDYLDFKFVLSDFENPFINYRHVYFNSKENTVALKDILKPNAPAMKYLKTSNLVQNIESNKTNLENKNFKHNNYDENTKIKILAKYLLTKGELMSAVRLQKLLFLIRYEEIASGDLTNSYFEDNDNFQAWSSGPVNLESYYYLRPVFIETDERDHYLLSKEQVEKIDQKYKAFFEKWKSYSDNDLINVCQTNGAWIKARAEIDLNEPCTDYLDEKSPEFLEMITNEDRVQKLKNKIVATFNASDENPFYDLSELLNYDPNQMRTDEIEYLSTWLSKKVEAKDLFNKYEGSSNPDNLVDIYNKLFLFITKQYNMDYSYSTYFSQLSYRNLNNLKNAYFELFDKTKGDVLNDFFIQKIIKRKSKFRNDFLVTTEILNLEKIKFDIKKKYIDNNETFLDVELLRDKNVKEYYRKKYIDSKKYRITI